MSDVSPIVVARVRGLATVPPAHTPSDDEPGRPVRSLHLNESPFGPSPAAVAAMREAVSLLNRYPDHDGSLLIGRLSARSDVPAGRIVIGAGSNELLYASADVCLDAGHEAVAPVPGFPTYAKTIALRGATHVGVPVRADGTVDVEAMLAAITGRTRLVFAASPHNPTGGLLDAAGVEALARGVPDDVLLHFDEAYFEFGRHAGGPDALASLQARRGPWIITRSFSKAFGLAGARLGYGLCSDAGLADAYRRIRVNFSVNATALAGALAALGDHGHLEKILAHTAAERAVLSRGLASLGYAVLPSAANFVSAIVPDAAGDPVARLRAENVFIGGFAWIDGRKAVRITIGSREDTEAVLSLLGAAP